MQSVLLDITTPLRFFVRRKAAFAVIVSGRGRFRLMTAGGWLFMLRVRTEPRPKAAKREKLKVFDRGCE
jgi:hypothetical protein